MSKKNTAALGEPLLLRIIRRVYPVLEKTVPPLAYRLAFRLFFTPVRYPVPEREKPVLDRARSFDHRINGKRTRFYCWGDTSGPLVILVHGWMGRAGQFFEMINALAERGFHVAGFDGPGHGRSAGSQTNVIEFAAAIRHIAGKFGPVHSAIGHSFGGITILHAIETGVPIPNVVLISTPTIGSEIIAQYQEKINASPHTGSIFKKMIRERYGFEFDDISAAETIRRIEVPRLLLVHDEDDRDVPLRHATVMAGRAPQAETFFTKGLGHTRLLRHPQVVDRVVRFVEEAALLPAGR